MALLLWFLPGRVRSNASSAAARTKTLDDLATIIFSSGSTGEPKGVMLTHYNIASNIEQVGQMFMFDRNDRLLGVLPFFHSFGFTVTLWLPAALGVSVVYHPSPLDLAAVSELVRDYRVTFLLSTPTFLQAYLRRCSPEDFGSLQYVVVGAEKLARARSRWPSRIASASARSKAMAPRNVRRSSPSTRATFAPPVFARSAQNAAASAIRFRASACASSIRTRASRSPPARRDCCSCAGPT